MTRVDLPFPAHALSQNSRVHWSAKADKTAKARLDARVACLGAGIRKGGSSASLRVEFRPPDARRRDVQNVIGTLKGAIDGISDALGIDDSRFTIQWPTAFAEPVKHGAVVVWIEVSP